MNWLKIPPGKSGAREVAVALLILWSFVLCWLLFWLSKDDVPAYRETFSTITTAIFTFALGAFGVAAVMNRVPTPAPPANARTTGPAATRRPIPEED